MKTSSERPNLWYVFVTLFALFWMPSITKLILSIYGNAWVFGIPDFIILAFAWVYLIRDLIKQVSLFFYKGVK